MPWDGIRRNYISICQETRKTSKPDARGCTKRGDAGDMREDDNGEEGERHGD
jgi:hypothetical protein